MCNLDKIYSVGFCAFFAGFFTFRAAATTYYVDINSPNPTPPYTSWSTAATNIQDAVDAASRRDTVLVTNGVYQTGGRPVVTPDFGPILTNRVVVTNSILLRSVNGPAVTVITGYQVPGTTNDYGAVRCVYLDDGAILSGFTLSNGATGPSGSDGIWESWGGGVNCPSGDAVVTNCIIVNNAAGDSGGGCQGGSFYNCQFVGNLSCYGGGAEGAIADNCMFTHDCAFCGGYGSGGGADNSTLKNCIMANNSSDYGGGASWSTLNNCALYANSSGSSGGGAGNSTLNNCTLTGNSADGSGGGADGSTLNNSIVYFNFAQAGANFSGSTLNFCCATPLPDSGTNDITAAPQMADDDHVAANSPCIGAGSPYYSTGVDIDGQPWLSPPSIGCDEFYAGAVTGALSVAVAADYSEASTGFYLNLSAQVSGRARSNAWNFGDGSVVSNAVFIAHDWMTPGDYPVTFTAYNDDNPGGVSATTTVHVAVQLVYYVDINSTNPVAPFHSWSTAATNIQDAIDVAVPASNSLVLITNGIYESGGRPSDDSVTNCVVVSSPILLQSVNGPGTTAIDGAAAMRCIYLAAGARLAGFTLTNGESSGDGGGVFCETGASVSNCVLTGNSADGNGGGAAGGGSIFNSTLEGNLAANNGGGANNSTLSNCLVAANLADGSGGGAESSTLLDCVVCRNMADYGGGADSCGLYNCLFTNNTATVTGGGVNGSYDINCTIANNSAGQDGGGGAGSELDNCIVYFNTAPTNANIALGNSTVNYSCTTPQAPGTDNFTNDPAFVDLAEGNLRLQSNSPCINAGNDSYLTENNAGISLATDLDGNPRVAGFIVDCGAYEFPIPAVIAATYTNVVDGFTVNFNWQIDAGTVSEFIINFGDGTVLTNPVTAAHNWTSPGDYTVTITAFTDLYPNGVSADVEVNVAEGNYYVSMTSANPQPPYESWGTAATNIQDAVNAAFAGGTIWVSNGVYQTGLSTADGSVTNRVTMAGPLTLRSVNGPAQTAIDGGSAVRCVYLAGDAILNGFTLQNGNASGNGGGVAGDSTNVMVTNCVINGNSAATGGGAFQATLIGCTVSSNSTATGGGGVESCVANSCTLAANTAGYWGGGADSSLLNDCLLTNNFATGNGGGASSSTLNLCTLANNASAGSGGGAEGGILNGCVLFANTAAYGGGGADGATLNNCTLTGNSTDGSGGGAQGSTLDNSSLSDNSAFTSGGGVAGSMLNNCTLTGNSADATGGGADSSTLNDCIVYYNSALSGTNFSGSTLNFCCTTPLPDSGTNNITADPQMADAEHISAGSPCVGAGSANYSTGVDIDGEPWLNPPSIGCDEYYSGAITGALSVAIVAYYTNVSSGFATDLRALIGGHANGNVWNFGDGTVVSNSPYVLHSWSVAGDYAVVLSAYNESYPNGLSATITIHVVAPPVYYVALMNTNPVAPYASWATAATNIQDAVDAASAGGTILVSNGVYQTGGQVVHGCLTNRVAISKAITVQGVNGPEVTVIQGYQPGGTNGDNAVRCVYLTNGVFLSGFTLTQGATRSAGDSSHDQSGGGIWCESAGATVSNCVISGNLAVASGGGIFRGTLNNCVISENSAAASGGGAFQSTLAGSTLTGNSSFSGGGASGSTLVGCTLNNNSGEPYGGGADSSTLNNCVLADNSAGEAGGGASGSTLNNCVITGNSAVYAGAVLGSTLKNCTVVGNIGAGIYILEGGGGADYSTLNNCIIYFNTPPRQPDYNDNTLSYCCTTPNPGGTGNITNDPALVNWTNSDFHLQSNSPCINSGYNAYAPGPTDLDGNPRIVGGTVDIGAYEYQTPTSVISYAWLQQYGLPTDGSADFADTDGDGMNNWQEWIAGTDPTDPASVLRMLAPSNSPAGEVISWESVVGVNYFVQRSTNLTAHPAFTCIQTNLPGQPGVTSYTDANAPAGASYFYRVGVQPAP